ncbi:lipopolysaccharide biosynthesis protein [Paraburkholderia sp. ZP32-5]|uniref:lipopolysaccharide biosynthesis protein n=1 Tax=Paraburkholderia sp. ZP32-5 TaxID=2883245 RepID=UPI001F2231B7|nr:oligosaccharide flippase family protein [Paraburkholderia sp. ZP32-5]
MTSVGPARLPPFVRRIASSFVFRLSGAVANFSFVIFLGRYLGASQTGLYMIGLGFLSVLSTFCRLGLEQIVIREGGPMVRDRQWPELKRLYRQTMLLAAVASVVLTLAVVLLSKPLANHVFHKQELAPVLVWFAAALLPTSIAMMHVPFLQIAGKPERSIAVFSVWVPLFSLLALVCVPPSSAVTATCIFLLASVANLAIAYLPVRAFVRGADSRSRPPGPLWNVSLLRPALPLLIGNTCQMALLWIAVFAVGIYASPAEVGGYSVAQRVALTLSGFLVPPIDALVGPKLAMMRGVASKRDIEWIVHRVSAALLLFVSALFVVLVIAGHQLLRVFGNDFGAGYGPLIFLSAGQLAVVASGSIRPLLVVHGLEKVIRNAMVIATLACIILAAILVPTLGGTGAALATALTLAGEKLAEGFVAWKTLGICVYPSLSFYRRQIAIVLKPRAKRTQTE